MAKRRRSSWVPRWLRHRTLATSEALLLVGACQELLQRQVAALALPNWGKVLWVMGTTLGLLSVVLLVLRSVAAKGVVKTHDMVQAIPLPTPYLLVHALVYAGLFLLYAYVWELLPLR
jgi:hypothetical protein